MKIAYIILAHKLPAQLVRLVKKLYTDTSSFLIHVDKKTDNETYQKMVDPLCVYENVHFLKRHVSNWGAFGQIQATLDGLREALTLNLDFDYAILLTGQDYPIKSNMYIHQFLEDSGKRSYMEYFSLPSEVWANENGGMDRINYWHLYFLGGPHKILSRSYLPWHKLPGELKVFGGRSNWCLRRECLVYIDEYLRRNNKVIQFFKHAGLPDEIFFQTILLNSHFKSQLINDNLKYVDWSDLLAHPAILLTRDYEKLINSTGLFARKFDETVDANILDMIDRVTD